MYPYGYRVFFDLSHGVIDVVVLIFSWRAYFLVRRSPDKTWHRHTGWLWLFLVSAVATCLFRAVTNLHSVFGMPMNAGFLLFNSTLVLLGDIINMIGVYVMLRALRQVVESPSLVHRPVEEWPQPPGKTTEPSPRPDANPW